MTHDPYPEEQHLTPVQYAFQAADALHAAARHLDNLHHATAGDLDKRFELAGAGFDVKRARFLHALHKDILGMARQWNQETP